jgi:hypothetical protein
MRRSTRTVGRPQLVRLAAGKLAVDQVSGDLIRPGMAPLGPAGGPGKTGAAHQQRHRAERPRSAAKPQLGVHPTAAVGAMSALVDLDDEVAAR